MNITKKKQTHKYRELVIPVWSGMGEGQNRGMRLSDTDC